MLFLLLLFVVNRINVGTVEMVNNQCTADTCVAMKITFRVLVSVF